jgi:hypothetical protein
MPSVDDIVLGQDLGLGRYPVVGIMRDVLGIFDGEPWVMAPSHHADVQELRDKIVAHDPDFSAHESTLAWAVRRLESAGELGTITAHGTRWFGSASSISMIERGMSDLPGQGVEGVMPKVTLSERGRGDVIPKATPEEVLAAPDLTQDDMDEVRHRVTAWLLASQEARRNNPWSESPLAVGEDMPVIDTRLLALHIRSDALYPTPAIQGRKVNWRKVAGDLLLMRARGISLQRCADHYGVTAGSVRQVVANVIRKLATLASKGKFTPLAMYGNSPQNALTERIIEETNDDN